MTKDPCGYDPVDGQTCQGGTHREVAVNVDELLTKAKNGLETKMVYGEPYETDGVTVIVASTVSTGGGGGDSRDEKGRSGLVVTSGATEKDVHDLFQ